MEEDNKLSISKLILTCLLTILLNHIIIVKYFVTTRYIHSFDAILESMFFPYGVFIFPGITSVLLLAIFLKLGKVRLNKIHLFFFVLNAVISIVLFILWAISKIDLM